MKTISIVMILLLSSSLWAQHPLLCDRPLKDFGTVEEGQRLSHTFVIKNVSSETIQVDRIVSSCGCIVTSKKEFTLSPNESTDIVVDFNSFGSGGMRIHKTVAVCIKDDKFPPLVLTVQAQIKGIPPEKRILITPNEKTIDDDPNKKHTLLLQVPTEPNINFSVQVPEWLNYSMYKSKQNTMQGTVLWEIEISLKNKLSRRISDNVVVNSNLPLFEKTTASIQVIPKPAFIITPYMIVFDTSKQKQTETVLIKSGEQQVESVYASMEIKPSKECLKINWDKGTPAKEVKLEITNEGCDVRPARLEILLNNDVVGIIPIVFK